MLMPMRAMQIWFFGPSLWRKPYLGSVFSCVPQPSSEVVVPSSRKPSMLQVLTNSSICFGTSVIWVSRSLQWITLTPSSLARCANFPAAMWPLRASALRPLAFFSSIAAVAMSIRPCFVKCEMSPGLAPCSTTAVGALRAPLGHHPADVHVAPVERALRRVHLAARIRVPHLDRCIDVKDTVVAAPLQEDAGVDVPRQVDQHVAAREIPAEDLLEVLLGHPVPDERHPHRGPFPELLLLALEIDHGDLLRGHLDVLEQDGERAFGDCAVADEYDLLAEFDHGLLGRFANR